MRDTDKGRGGIDNGFPGNKNGGNSARYDTAYIVASLLVLVARGDGEVCQAEIDTMIGLVAQRFELTSAAALEHIKTAMQETSCDLELPQIVRARVRHLGVSDKQQILTMLLEVAQADGVQQADELRAIEVAAKLIDLPAAAVHEVYRVYFSRDSG